MRMARCASVLVLSSLLITVSPLSITANSGIQTGPSEPSSRPNFLLIVADDLGYSDLGCYGSEIQTPNLDRLAAEGLRFSQFYNNAKCIPTRASLMTGLYPRGPRPRLTTNMVTVAEALKSAGYQTALSGKWHLGQNPPHRPMDRGFDEFYGLMDGCCNYFDPGQRDPEFEGGRFRTFAHNDQRLKNFPSGFYTTDAFTDHAMNTLRRFAQTKKPFFLNVCYTAPHSPIHAPEEDIQKYLGKYKGGWEAVRKARHQRLVKLGLVSRDWRLPPPDELVYDWQTTDQDWEDRRMAVYAAMVDRMDQNIGRLLRELKKLAIETNTVVMFLSDNGSSGEEAGGRNTSMTPGPKSSYMNVGPGWGWAHNTPFRRYKTWVHEGGISTPFIVRWQGVVRTNSITHETAHVIDLMPTLLDMAKAKSPSEPKLPLEGRSLFSLFQGVSDSKSRTLFWEESGNRAVRRENWKLVSEAKTGSWELYDIVSDRTEMTNLASRNPAIVRELAAAYERWARHTARTNAPQSSQNVCAPNLVSPK